MCEFETWNELKLKRLHNAIQSLDFVFYNGLYNK